MIHFGLELFISFLIGTLFYFTFSLSVKTEENCTMMSNIWTDILSFGFGFILIYLGSVKYKDMFLAVMGMFTITEHIWQLYFNKFIPYFKKYE